MILSHLFVSLKKNTTLSVLNFCSTFSVCYIKVVSQIFLFILGSQETAINQTEMETEANVFKSEGLPDTIIFFTLIIF